MTRDLIPIGRVVRPHGVRGKIKLEYFGEECAPAELLYFSDYSEFFISKIYPFIGGKPDAICIKNNTPYMMFQSLFWWMFH